MILVLCSWKIFNGLMPDSAVKFHCAIPENVINTHPVEISFLEILGERGVHKTKIFETEMEFPMEWGLDEAKTNLLWGQKGFVLEAHILRLTSGLCNRVN